MSAITSILASAEEVRLECLKWAHLPPVATHDCESALSRSAVRLPRIAMHMADFIDDVVAALRHEPAPVATLSIGPTLEAVVMPLARLMERGDLSWADRQSIAAAITACEEHWLSMRAQTTKPGGTG